MRQPGSRPQQTEVAIHKMLLLQNSGMLKQQDNRDFANASKVFGYTRVTPSMAHLPRSSFAEGFTDEVTSLPAGGGEGNPREPKERQQLFLNA